MLPYINIFGVQFGTYGICMVLGVALVVLLAARRGKKYKICFEDIIIVGATTVSLALVGGNLLYVIVTYPIDVIVAQIKDGSFAFLSGGIVFYGGLIGGIFGAMLGVKLAKIDFTAIEYSIVPFVPLGHAIGRIGCVMAGCCHGFEYDGPFALYYPNAISGLSPEQGYFPIQLVEALLNVGICVVLLICAKKLSRRYDLLISYMGCYGVARFILEIFRGDAVRGIYFSLSVSQWISIGMVAICILWFLVIRRKSRKNTVQPKLTD